MPSLAEHIASFESEIAMMTNDGHHLYDSEVRAALERFDTGIGMLNAAKRRQLVEGTPEPRPAKHPLKNRPAKSKKQPRMDAD
jgi:hypothetical protein